MSLQRQRLTADPCLGVGDIMQPLVAWMKEKGTYDLSSLLEPKTTVSWKTAPNIDWLCSLEKLFEKLLKAVPACILPSKKVKLALQKIQSEVTRINFGRKDDDHFFDRMDQLLRIASAQLRDIKQQLSVYQRTMKKASVIEKERVDALLMLIHIPANEVEETETQKSEKKPPIKESCTALVPYVEPKTTRPAPEGSGSCPDIFKRILSKKLSDESAGPGDAQSPLRLAATSSGPSSSSRSLGREVAWGDFDRSEKDLLAEALNKACHRCSCSNAACLYHVMLGKNLFQLIDCM